MEQLCSITGEVAHKRKVEEAYYVELHRTSDAQETAVKMLVDPLALQHLPCFEFLLQQLHRGSNWTFTGQMSLTKKRKLPVLLVQSLQLLKISGSVESVKSLLEGGENATVPEALLARALRPRLEEAEAVARFRELLVEYTASEQRSQFIDNLSRTLLAGVPRQIRQRATKLPPALLELMKSEQCRAIRDGWPIQQYQIDATHQEIAETVKVDHLDHVECHTLEERMQYLAEKKRPQVAAMINTIEQLIRSMGMHPQQDKVVFVDVGGGRGDLSLAVVERFPYCKMLVVDVNAAALESARTEALDRGIADRVTFLNVGWASPVPTEVMNVVTTLQTQDQQAAAKVPVILIGLHACGGLSDALLQACSSHDWSFCCCPCCFASHKHLRAWKPKAVCQASGWWQLANALLTALGGLAESPRTVHQQPAMHLINAIRCQLCVLVSRGACDELPPRLLDLLGLATQLGIVSSVSIAADDEDKDEPCRQSDMVSRWEIQIREFSREWSGRSMIIVGRAPLR